MTDIGLSGTLDRETTSADQPVASSHRQPAGPAPAGGRRGRRSAAPAPPPAIPASSVNTRRHGEATSAPDCAARTGRPTSCTFTPGGGVQAARIASITRCCSASGIRRMPNASVAAPPVGGNGVLGEVRRDRPQQAVHLGRGALRFGGGGRGLAGRGGLDGLEDWRGRWRWRGGQALPFEQGRQRKGGAQSRAAAAAGGAVAEAPQHLALVASSSIRSSWRLATFLPSPSDRFPHPPGGGLERVEAAQRSAGSGAPAFLGWFRRASAFEPPAERGEVRGRRRSRGRGCVPRTRARPGRSGG